MVVCPLFVILLVFLTGTYLHTIWFNLVFHASIKNIIRQICVGTCLSAFSSMFQGAWAKLTCISVCPAYAFRVEWLIKAWYTHQCVLGRYWIHSLLLKLKSKTQGYFSNQRFGFWVLFSLAFSTALPFLPCSLQPNTRMFHAPKMSITREWGQFRLPIINSFSVLQIQFMLYC